MRQRDPVQIYDQFELDKKNESWHVTIINAEEKIDVDEIEQRKDSLFIQLPIFESEFILKIVDIS